MFKPEFLGVGTVGERGQVSIPAEARKACNIEPGQKLVFLTMDDGGFVVVKADRLDIAFKEMAKNAERIAKMVNETNA